ncbi:MAG TPA: GTP-binding protein [Candidatus Thermoplasmatota archaeon]|nr:GTP-binding protein [Candidatus Thermoplasmatota archaeon]
MPALDRSLGDIPPGGLVLLRHDPTVEAAPFVLQAAASHLRLGVEVVYLVTNRSPSRTLEALLELDGHPDRRLFHVVDAHSALMGAADVASYAVKNPADLAQTVARLDQAARDHPQAVLLVDSLSGLLDHSDEGPFLAELPGFQAVARRFRFCAAVWTAWPYSEEVEKALTGFDAVVTLRGVEERVVLHQTLAVERSNWSPPAPPMLYKVDRPGGVLVYVPKVVVLGPASAGKTTFVHSLAGDALSVERMGTTVAMDRGTVTLDGVKVEVFGTPGQTRFDPLLPTLASQAVGAILLVDATSPESFGRAKDMLQKVWKRGLRAVIALNKSDLPGALTPAQARRGLTPPPGVEMVTCVATDADSARKVLRHLVDDVLSSGSQAGAAQPPGAGGAA